LLLYLTVGPGIVPTAIGVEESTMRPASTSAWLYLFARDARGKRGPRPSSRALNTTGLRKIMIVSEMLYPGERATELQQSLTQNVIDRDSWRNCANGTARTDCSVTAMLADWR